MDEEHDHTERQEAEAPTVAGDLALAVDIGGTNVKAGLLNRCGELLDVLRAPTPATAPPEGVVREVEALLDRLCRRAGVSYDVLQGIGVSIAGFITADGVVTATAHLSPQWVGYDLRARLRRTCNLEYHFALDTPAPALGEAYYGAGRGVAHFAYVTVSTGIGAGIIADGHYFAGGLGWAGGVGHTIVDERSERRCEGCGNRGCLETFAAKQGILATARDLLNTHPESRILALAGGEAAAITPEIVFEAARHGDVAARTVFARAGHALGVGLTNLVDIVAPQRVVVGGGIAQAGDLLLEPARAVVRERAFPPQLRAVEIVPAALGDLSAVYGAAAMVFHDLRVNLPEPGGPGA
jgi:glucokinase